MRSCSADARDLLRTNPPRRLFEQMPRIPNPFAAIEERAASRQCRQTEPVADSIRMKKAPSVVIAKEGQDTRCAHHFIQKTRHASQLFANRVVVRPQDSMEQEHIERVDVRIR